ncbi:MAG: EAL domain-containing protein [Gammaproteobacteria bacterium]|nr:EAL domain-containing protein [Gammaproteobacteria bacterium]
MRLRWRRVPLLIRLISVVTLVVLMAATVRTLMLIQEIRDLVNTRLSDETNIVRQAMPPVLIDYLIRGDYSSIKPILQNQVNASSDLQRISWQNQNSQLSVVDDDVGANHAPVWFREQLGIIQSEFFIPLELGGVNYGSLTLTYDLDHVLYPGWQQVTNQMRALGMVILLVALMTFLLFRGTLRGMRELQSAALDFQQGKLGTRLPPGDSAEISALSESFNAMAQKISDLIQRLHTEKELAEVTLSSIGDAVITTDAQSRVTFLNQVASHLTGYPLEEALGKPVSEIFHVIEESTREPMETPVEQALRHGNTVKLSNHSVLISRDGENFNIEDSAALIHLPDGSLAGCVLVFHDVTEKHRLLSRVQWQAGHDALTGLPNRILLTDRFEQAIAVAKRHRRLLGVCLVDLDAFKPVNDRYGHAVGDLLLIEVSTRLRKSMRAEDTVARLGGDEFVLILNDVGEEEEVHHAVRRILNAIAAPYTIEGVTIHISACIGVTLYPVDNADADTLMRHADQAMYQAKQIGSNRYQMFDVTLHEETRAGHQTLERIRTAMLQGELSLHYQPKVNMRSGQVVGFEALLRWQHPHDGQVLPPDFLPLIEQSELIVEIGEWVIDQALQQIGLWQEQGMLWPVSVNIAAPHFQNDDFFDRLNMLLTRHNNVAPRLLEIEIVESVALGDVAQVSKVIAACQGLGVTFSLDDFGTGYSSLNYLRHLPVNTLKIDQSFVRDMLVDEDDLALVEAVISMARLFARDVIAEGVETSDHGVLLMRLGCDIAQGFGIARPMPAQEVVLWAQQYQPEPQWRMWSDLKWELCDLPLLVAQHDHLGWVKNVLLTVEQNDQPVNDTQLVDHHHCSFGHWCYGPGKQNYGHLPEFSAIEPVHVKVHQLGSEIIRLRETGDFEQARALCVELLTLKDQICLQLGDLQNAVANIHKKSRLSA